MDDEIHRTTLYIPRQLWKKIRKIAFDKNTAANSLIVKVLTEKYGDATQ